MENQYSKNFHKVNDLVESLFKIIFKKENLVHEQCDLTEALKRDFYVSLEGPQNKTTFYHDLKKKKLKKNYYFSNYYESILAKKLTKRLKVKPSLNTGKFSAHLANLNLITNYLVRIKTSWNYSFSLKKVLNNKKNNTFIFFFGKNSFSQKLFNENIKKHYKKKNFLFINHNKNILDRISFFLQNCYLTLFKRYKTNNSILLNLKMRQDIMNYSFKKFNLSNAIFFEGDSSDDALSTLILKRYNVETQLFQQGSFTGEKVPVFLRNLQYNYIFCFGDFFKKKLIKHNLNRKIISIGRVGRNYKKQKKNNKILFAFQDTINPDSVISSEAADKFKIFAIWCASKFPNYQIIIKPHPKYILEDNFIKKISRFKNTRMIPRSKDIIDYMDDAKFVISHNSTALLDALIYDVLPIHFIPEDYILSPNVKKYKIGVLVGTLNSAKKTLADLISNNKRIEHMVYKKKSFFLKNNFNKNYNIQVTKLGLAK